MHHQVNGKGDGGQNRRVSERAMVSNWQKNRKPLFVCLLLGRLARIVFLAEMCCWFIVVAAPCIVPLLRCGAFCCLRSAQCQC